MSGQGKAVDSADAIAMGRELSGSYAYSGASTSGSHRPRLTGTRTPPLGVHTVRAQLGQSYPRHTPVLTLTLPLSVRLPLLSPSLLPHSAPSDTQLPRAPVPVLGQDGPLARDQRPPPHRQGRRVRGQAPAHCQDLRPALVSRLVAGGRRAKKRTSARRNSPLAVVCASVACICAFLPRLWRQRLCPY